MPHDTAATTLPASYYEAKIDTLRDLFGEQDVRVEADRIHVGSRNYPVVDDVIIVLQPAQYPEFLRARLAQREAAGTVDRSVFAEDIQATFGSEWTSFPEILPDHEVLFRQYFDIVDTDALGDHRICDLGCGIGRWAYFLRQKCRELVLVDFSEAIFVARKNLKDTPQTLFFMGDIKALPFRNDFCDFLYCLGVLHHLPTPALQEVRALARYAPKLLIYLYYALDNRPAHFRALLRLVTVFRSRLAKIHSPRFRSGFTWVVGLGVYTPLIWLGRALKPVGLHDHVPIYSFYNQCSVTQIRQDVYDRFFTSIEQRVTREEITGLKDTFADVKISDGLPFWHFLCRR